MPAGRFHNPYFEQHTQRQHAWRRDALSIGGSVALFVILSWFVFGYKQVLSARQIVISGEQYLTVDQIAEATRTALQRRRWLVLKQRFLPILDETILAADIQTELSQFVQLESITVTTDWPHSITVQVVERVPGYVYIAGKEYYYLDVHGAITQSVVEAKADPHFPHIRERNKKRQVAIGEVIFQPTLMDFISQLHDQFSPITQLNIAEYAILPVSCQEKQYVTDKIFADEIAGSTSETVKQQKRDILDQLQNDQITVDQSLDLLEEVKRKEQGDEETDTGNETFIKLETEYKTVKCDYQTVVRDVAVVTQEGVELYFDSSLDLNQQLTNAQTVLSDGETDVDTLTYIDLRFTDRAYYR